MASPCVVQFCTNIGNHRFPKDETRKAEWIRAIKHVKPGLTIRHNSFLCSAHFRPTDFAITLTHLKRGKLENKLLHHVKYLYENHAKRDWSMQIKYLSTYRAPNI